MAPFIMGSGGEWAIMSSPVSVAVNIPNVPTPTNTQNTQKIRAAIDLGVLSPYPRCGIFYRNLELYLVSKTLFVRKDYI